MSDPGSGKNQKSQLSSSLLPEGLPSFEEVTRSMQVIHTFLIEVSLQVLHDRIHIQGISKR